MSRPYGQPKTEEERLESHEGKYGSSVLPPRGTRIKNTPDGVTRNMSFTQRLINALETGLWKFVKVVLSANREYPFHDYESVGDGSEPVAYRVGQNQVDLHGDQTKHFVAKSTLVYSDVACTIRFNHTNNVAIAILANTWYEFKSNVTYVYVSAIGAQGTIYMYFEGVLPQEARDAE